MQFEVGISSEVAGVGNFLLCELVAMAYIMHVSGLVAGALNHGRVKNGEKICLRPFDAPHFGGGLVMGKTASRYLLIFLRVSAVVAVAVGNFGLEGRTKIVTESHVGVVRSPGKMAPLSRANLFNATERRMRCATVQGEDLLFGTVVDGLCYHDLRTAVYVQSLGLQYHQFKADAVNCVKHVEKDMHFTVFRCDGADISCMGLEMDGMSWRGRCESVLYREDESWLCSIESALPGMRNVPVECRKMKASREAVEQWTSIFRYRTTDLMTAVFGAAYGVEKRELVRIPVGERNVTVVTLFWMVAIGYLGLVVVGVSIWAFVVGGGRRRFAHDENGLLRLLVASVGDVDEAAVWAMRKEMDVEALCAVD